MSRTDVQLYDKNGNEINPKTLASLVTMDGAAQLSRKWPHWKTPSRMQGMP